ncbi:nucleoside triphosphate hydrolase [Nocardia cyriacigeorgica]|uniref:nucleoside triphosphate hydrolase n=1 Tax=Nocardia cyriacigeorgica TaxID=135487 RepID=UPI0024555E7A|nr:nucleoside triphosphate hydrolase [Nocardia cyriacigeorgica]
MSRVPVSVDCLALDVFAAAERSGSDRRFILGVAGPPAAGKSTFSLALCDALNRREAGIAAVAPMDGFHRTTADLSRTGELSTKGQPQTFDVEGFATKLRELRASSPGTVVGWPTYDRGIHDPVPNGVLFDRQRIVVVEGNYLLLDLPGWSGIQPLLDMAWYLRADIGEIERRLGERHIAGGKTPSEASRKIATSDLPNAELVARTAERADLILDSRDGQYFRV